MSQDLAQVESVIEAEVGEISTLETQMKRRIRKRDLKITRGQFLFKKYY